MNTQQWLNVLQWLAPIITSPDFCWVAWLVFVTIIWFIFAMRVEPVVDGMRSMDGEDQNGQ